MIDLNGKKGNVRNYGAGSTVVGGGNFTGISNIGEFAYIEGGASVDYITNQAANSLIDGGNGDDVIENTADRTYVYGGAGNDTFVISDGTGVVITDFNADEDIISIASGASSILNDNGMIEITVGNPVEPVDSTEYTPQIGVMKRFVGRGDLSVERHLHRRRLDTLRHSRSLVAHECSTDDRSRHLLVVARRLDRSHQPELRLHLQRRGHCQSSYALGLRRHR